MRVFRLEAVVYGKVSLDQGADSLDHQVGVLREGVQYIMVTLKGRQSIKKVCHKLMLLLP
jgi:hypothetical protein